MAFGLCWVLASSLSTESRRSGDRRILESRVNILLKRHHSLGLNPKAEKKMIKSLLTLGRIQEARSAVEEIVAKDQSKLGWRLLLVELKRQTGDKKIALEEINYLVGVHHKNIEILELKALLDIENKTPYASLSLIKKRFENATKPNRMRLGLLLADLHQNMKQNSSAELIYKLLAEEMKGDAKPVIALAAMKQKAKLFSEAQLLLREARKRRTKPGEIDSLIDDLASEWALQAERSNLNYR